MRTPRILVLACLAALPVARARAQTAPAPKPGERVISAGTATVKATFKQPLFDLPPDETAVKIDETDDADDSSDDGDGEGEAESEVPATGTQLPDHYYTADLTDAELERIWKADRSSLGSISVGLADAGRLLNGEPFPDSGGPWAIITPGVCWGTHETIEFLKTAFKAVDAEFPGGPPARVNHISGKAGGYLHPHHSHQTGRDADVGFYYKTYPGPVARNREKFMDMPRNWSLIRNLATQTDVQVILVDKSIQKVLVQYALSVGEDKQWVDSLFHAGKASLVQHARHHKDHFHVRFFSARAQELGRRIQPMLMKSKDEHSTLAHHIKPGETLGHIAKKYGVTIAMLRQANGLKQSSLIRAGRVLAVPVRGACVNCPIPPPLVVPPRRLPPGATLSQTDLAKSAPPAQASATPAN